MFNWNRLSRFCISAPLAFSHLVFRPQESPQAAALNIGGQFSSPIKLLTSELAAPAQHLSAAQRQILTAFPQPEGLIPAFVTT